MCDHDDLFAVQGGYYCPECKTFFKELPVRPVKITFLNTEEKKEEKPKTTRKKKTDE